MRVKTILFMALGFAFCLSGALIGVETTLSPWMLRAGAVASKAQAQVTALQVERSLKDTRKRLESATTAVSASPIFATYLQAEEDPELKEQLLNVVEEVGVQLGAQSEVSLLNKAGAVLVGDALIGASEATRDAAAGQGIAFRIEKGVSGTRFVVAVPIMPGGSNRVLLSERPFLGVLAVTQVLQAARAASWVGASSTAQQFALVEGSEPLLSVTNRELLQAALEGRADEIEMGDSRYCVVQRNVVEAGRSLTILAFALVDDGRLFLLAVRMLLILLCAACFALSALVVVFGARSDSLGNEDEASFPRPQRSNSASWLPAANIPLRSQSTEPSPRDSSQSGRIPSIPPRPVKTFDSADLSGASSLTPSMEPAEARFGTYGGVGNAEAERLPAPLPRMKSASRLPPPARPPSMPPPLSPSEDLVPPPVVDTLDQPAAPRAVSAPPPPPSPEPRKDSFRSMETPSFDAIAAAAKASAPAPASEVQGSEDLPVPKGGLSPGMVAGQGLSEQAGVMAPSPRLEENLPIPKEQAPHLYDLAPRRTSSASVRPPSSAHPYDEVHYRRVFDDFLAAKGEVGEPTDGLEYTSFAEKLRTSEQDLIREYGCKAVRFQVLVKEDTVSLRPQLVR